MDYDFSKAKIILYSLKEQSYYDATSHEAMDVTDVFAINEMHTPEAETTEVNEDDAEQEASAETETAPSEDLENEAETAEGSIETEAELPAATISNAPEKEAPVTYMPPVTEAVAMSKKVVAQETVSVDEVRNTIYRMLASHQFYAATAYARIMRDMMK